MSDEKRSNGGLRLAGIMIPVSVVAALVGWLVRAAWASATLSVTVESVAWSQKNEIKPALKDLQAWQATTAQQYIEIVRRLDRIDSKLDRQP